MKRPNLVNPQNWTPFKSVPIINQIPIRPVLPPIQQNVYQQIPVEVEIPRPLTRRELVQRNSFFLNIIGLIIIACISYFLYSIYLERKIFSEYLEYIRSNYEEQHGYNGFF